MYITLLAASSLKEVLTDLTDAYTKAHPQVTFDIAYGASGAMQKQIEEGAPGDLFISAGTKQMNALMDQKLLVDSEPVQVATNALVLIVPKENTLFESGTLKSFEDLVKDEVKIIGVGDPASVPAGQYAQQVFASLGIEAAVGGKLNNGTDVKQILSWVEAGEVDAGIVYETDALNNDKVTVVATASEDSHKPIVYPAAILASSGHQAEAQGFLDYLTGADVAVVWQHYGFGNK